MTEPARALLRLAADERDDEAFRVVARSRLGRGLDDEALRLLARHGALLPAARRGVLPPRYHAAVARIVALVDGLRSLPDDERLRTARRSVGAADGRRRRASRTGAPPPGASSPSPNERASSPRERHDHRTSAGPSEPWGGGASFS